jgi:TRAP-type C4-dicarboxylate transport system substrate-binding protein
MRRRAMGPMNRGRIRTLALFVVAAVAAAGCTGGSGGGDKAGGGGAPVVLRLANYADSLDLEPAVADFVKRVEDLSGGNVRIEVVSDWGGLGTTAGVEQQVVADVVAGKADLAWVGTRIFDTLGVKSFQALTAPMLIDSYPLERAVIGSEMPGQMLKSLDTLGVTGLAVLADGLRKPIAVARPLLGLADWRGITFAAFRSQGQARAIEELGARASDLWGGSLTQALDAGTVGGFEKSLLVYQLTGLKTQAPYVTANVNLWPQMVALLANPARLGKLTDAQRGWLGQAARDAAARSTSLAEHEDQIVTDLCQGGARLANASAADLAALRQAFVPVYAALEQDPQTKDLIGRIEALKGAAAAGTPLGIPAGCTGRAPGSGTGGTPNEDPIAGSWTTAKITESQIVRAFVALGGSEKEGHSFFVSFGTGSRKFAVFTLRFQDGSWEAFETGGDDPIHEDAGSYEIGEDSTVAFTSGSCTDTIKYDLSGDNLLLHFVEQCPAEDGYPYGPTYLGSFPFTRSS